MDTQKKDFKPETTEGREVRMHLDLDAAPFVTVGKFTRTTTMKLAILIREKLQTVFHDLKGCRIDYDFNSHSFLTTLVFENNSAPLPEGKIKNLVNVTREKSSSGRDLFDANRALQTRLTGKTYTLNKETKEALSDFMYGGPDNNKPDSKSWNRNVEERIENASAAYSGAMFNFNRYDTERILILVKGIDLRVLLRKLFGNTMVCETKTYDNGEQENIETTAYYEVRYIKNDTFAPGSVVINIEQFNKDAVQKIMAEEAAQMVPNGPYRYY